MIAGVTGAHTLARTLPTYDPPPRRTARAPGERIISRESVVGFSKLSVIRHTSHVCVLSVMETCELEKNKCRIPYGGLEIFHTFEIRTLFLHSYCGACHIRSPVTTVEKQMLEICCWVLIDITRVKKTQLYSNIII